MRRKIFRDSIQSIPNSALRRLERRAGVKTSSSEIYDVVRSYLVKWLNKAVQDSVTITEHLRARTVQPESVVLAFNFQGIDIVAATAKLSRAPPGGSAKKVTGGSTTKPHRFRSGTVALRDIKKQQKNSDTIAIASSAFNRLVRELGQDHHDDLSYSPMAITIFQLVTEYHLVQLFKKALLFAINRGRIRILISDINLAITMSPNKIMSAPIISGYNLSIYIYKVLKQVHPDTGMSVRAKVTMNNLIISLIGRVMHVANALVIQLKRKTVTSREIQSAIRIVMPDELGKHSVSKATRAITKFNASMTGRDKGDKSEKKNSRAGLTVSVSRIEKILVTYSSAKRKGIGAAVYLAAVVEYIMAEILELAGNSARYNKRVRIVPRDLLLAIRGDEEINELFPEDSYAIGGGVTQQ